MKNIWGIFLRDLGKLRKSVVPVIVIIGLCLVPCLYAWFNIMSNADPYGPSSTSNIKVVVTNEDEGSELLGLNINIGEMVIEGISANDQMGWCFVDTREEAMDGLYAGDYYAALIVPKDFTKDFLSILDGDLEHPEVEYYENEKKNAIAPKITSKAKTAVQEQINSTIVEKVADVINTISSIFNALGLDGEDVANGLTERMDEACQRLEETKDLMHSVRDLTVETKELLDLLGKTSTDAGQLFIDSGSVTHQIGNTADAVYDSSVTTQQNILNAVDIIDQQIEELINIFGSWSGDPSIKQNAAAYLTAAQSDISSITGYEQYVSTLGLSTAYSDISTMQRNLEVIQRQSAREEYMTLSEGVSSTLLNASTAYANALDAIDYAAQYASLAYQDIQDGASTGDYTYAIEDLTSAYNVMSGAGLSETYFSSEYDNLEYALSCLESYPADPNAALTYTQALYNGLSNKYNVMANGQSTIDTAVSSAYDNVDAAYQLVAQYEQGNVFSSQAVSTLTDIYNTLEELYNSTTDTNTREKLQNAMNAVQALITAVETATSPEASQTLIDLANAVRESLREVVVAVNGTLNDVIRQSAQSTIDTMDTLTDILSSGADGLTDIYTMTSAFSDAMSSATLTVDEATDLIDQVYDYTKGLSDDIRRIADSEAFHQLVEILENNPDGLADYLVSPVDMRTVTVYEIADYGSAMSPYYIMLALFVGSLLTAAMIKAQIPYEEYLRVPQIQRYFGRLILFLFIGLFQALVTALGCLFYVKIQCVNPLLFVLGCILISFNFVMMNYSFVYALDNIGLALSVIIMVIQVAGSGGSYPIHVLPQVFQDLYDFMPFHYGMDLLRETIGGFYEGTYLRCAGILLGMALLFFIIGITLYYPARKLNQIIAKSKAASGVM